MKTSLGPNPPPSTHLTAKVTPRAAHFPHPRLPDTGVWATNAHALLQSSVVVGNRIRHARRSGRRTSCEIHGPPLLGTRGNPAPSAVSPLHLITVAERER